MRSFQALPGFVLSLVVLLTACGGAASSPAPSAAPASPSTAASAKPVGSASAAASAKPAASAGTAASGKPAASASAGEKPAAASIAPAKPGQILAAYSEIVTSNLPMWTAKEAGIYQKNGLDVDLRLIESSLVVGALLSSQVQIGGVGGSETLAAAVEGGDLKILAITTPVYPYKLEVSKDIQTPQDLKGKKIGISRIGSSSDVATRAALKKIGLVPDKDVTVVQVGSLQARTAAMISGAIQGAVANPPDNITLEKQGFHPLVDLASLDLPASNNGLVVQGAWLGSHRDEAQKFIDSYIEAIARVKKDQNLAIDVMKKYLKNDDLSLLQPTYDYWVGKTMPALPYPKTDQFEDSVATVAEKNPRAKSYDLNKLIDPSFIKSAADRGVDKS